jgi:thymidylate kinase
MAVAVQACMKRPTAVLCTTAKDFFRLLYRIIRSPGLFIVLVGPDGCGKTSVGLALRKCLAGTFYTDNGLHLHWKARLINRPSNPTGTPCADPHGKPVRPNMESIAFFSAHVLEMIVAHEVKVRPVLFKNGLVLVERYYYDFFVDPRRYCMNIPQWLVKVLYRFVPKPDIVFFLDAPADVLQARKKEVSFAECQRQREAYLALTKNVPESIVIDATQPLTVVQDEACRVALHYLAERNQQITQS